MPYGLQEGTVAAREAWEFVGLTVTVVLYAPARGLSAPAYLRLAAVLAPSLLGSTRCGLHGRLPAQRARLRCRMERPLTKIPRGVPRGIFH